MILAALLAACRAAPTAPPPDDPSPIVASVAVTPPAVVLTVGQTVKLRGVARDPDGNELPEEEVTWSSEDPAVAEVDTGGRVTAKGSGKTKVSGAARGRKGSTDVSVTSPAVVGSVVVTPENASLLVGESVQLTAAAFDTAGAPIPGATFTWSTSSATVAAVNAGLVSAVAAGTATIAATFGGASGSSGIVVSAGPVPPPPPPGSLAAFPGAEGYGALSLADCRSKPIVVHEVTNTNDGGAGSLRDILTSRVSNDAYDIVVFRTGGTIAFGSSIDITRSCVYIAGQTAPGGGMQLAGSASPQALIMTPANGSGHDVVIRYLRLRLGKGDGRQTDNMWLRGGHNILIDHVSFAWGTDENLDLYAHPQGAGLRDITIQNSIVAAPLSPHNVNMLVGGQDGNTPTASGVSIVRNLFLHAGHRNPRISFASLEAVQVVNNVAYNWVNRVGSTAGASRVDLIGNYWKRGSISPGVYFEHQWEASGWPGGEADPLLYLSGNSDDAGVRSDQRTFFRYYDDRTGSLPASAFVSAPQASPSVPVRVTSAASAYSEVLSGAGASRRLACDGSWLDARDATDGRFVNDVTARTGPDNIPEDSDHESDFGGFPSLSTGSPCPDADGDGMPDAFEIRYGLDPGNPADATLDSDSDGYLNIEEYVNGTPPR